MNRKQMLGVLLALIALGMAGCQPEEPDAAPYYPEEFWGEWQGIGKLPYWTYSGSDPVVYITSNDIVIGKKNYGQNFSYTLEKVSKRVVKLKLLDEYSGYHTESTFYLFPLRTASASFTGNVVSLKPDTSSSFAASRAASGLGGIQITITNLNDAAQTYNVTTDQNGAFTTADTIPDEQYIINAGGHPVEVTSPADGGNVGTVTVTDGLNFKTSVSTANTDYGLRDHKDLYVGKPFNASLKVKNVGTQTAKAATYKITLDNGLALNSDSIDPLIGILGSIEPDKTGYIFLDLTCTSIEGESSFKKIYIEITDPINKKTWTDSVSVFFYASMLTLEARAQSEIVINIITPRNETYTFHNYTFGYGSRNFPRMTGDYIIAVIPTWEQPIYKLYFNSNTSTSESEFNKEAANFLDTGNYEPNDTEDTAVLITGDIMSYLHTGDIDYYKFRVE